MPSFFEAMKRLAMGKPIFDANDNLPQGTVATPTSATPARPASTIQKGNDRTYPAVYVRHTDVHRSGSHVQVYCHIHNSWHGEIMLDKIRALGTTRELDSSLHADEERQFLIYDGPALQQPRYDQVVLQYNTRERDYFEAVHEITFTFESDKTYTVDEIKLHPPIRDIYG